MCWTRNGNSLSFTTVIHFDSALVVNFSDRGSRFFVESFLGASVSTAESHLDLGWKELKHRWGGGSSGTLEAREAEGGAGTECPSRPRAWGEGKSASPLCLCPTPCSWLQPSRNQHKLYSQTSWWYRKPCAALSLSLPFVTFCNPTPRNSVASDCAPGQREMTVPFTHSSAGE